MTDKLQLLKIRLELKPVKSQYLQETQLTKSDTKSIHYINKGRFVQVAYNYIGKEKRIDNDRRKTLKGDPAKTDAGEERRKGSRRLEDIIITLEIKDDKEIYATYKVFKEIVRKIMHNNFAEISEDPDRESWINIDYGTQEVFVDCKMQYRDEIKQLMSQKGLTCTVIDTGVFLGEPNQVTAAVIQKHKKDKTPLDIETDSAQAAVLGFLPENLEKEINNIIFKVFVKCLNEVHPVAGDHERDALKQDVSLEQRIIFIAGKHYPKSKNFNFKTIIEQVFSEAIGKYNRMIQVDAEVIQLEERYKLSHNNNLIAVIQKKKAEVNKMRESSIEETIRTLYLYLDYFKDFIKVGLIKEKIENIFKKVNDRRIKVIRLDEIENQLTQVINEEKRIKKQKPDNLGELLGYIKWLKNEINREVYFVRFLWTNNLRGRAYIQDAFDRTMNSITPPPFDNSH